MRKKIIKKNKILKKKPVTTKSPNKKNVNTE